MRKAIGIKKGLASSKARCVPDEIRTRIDGTGINYSIH
jgi:hypothetical protein